MAPQLLLVILIYFYGSKAQDVLPPKLTVSPVEIVETDSVSLKCQTPSSVSQCYYLTVSGGTVRTWSCLQTLAATQLLHMANLRSPAEVELKCFYTIKGRRSPHSDSFFISIMPPPQPKLTVSPVEIVETDSVSLKCQTPSSVSQCYYLTASGGTVRTLSCLQTLAATQLLHMANLRSPAEVQVKCFYMVEGRRSPHSDPSFITIHSRRPSTDVIDTGDESSMIQTPRTTLTTGLIVSHSHTSAPVPGSESTSGETTAGHTVGTEALASVKQPTDISMTPTKAESDNKIKVTWVWMLIIAATACGMTCGVILLVSSLKAVSPAGAEAVEEDKGGSRSQNEDSQPYHLYSIIPEDPAAPVLINGAYSTVQQGLFNH